MGIAWLAGIFPPIATAFAPDGALRPPAAGFLEYLRDGGLDGVVALGSNGEATHLTEAERLRDIGSVREALPAPLRLIAGTGAESTRATIERTRAAAAEGAEAALVIAPSYFRRQLTADALRAHYHSVAEASPIPILIYNVPVHMGYDLGPDWIVRLTGHANIAGLKDSSGDIGRLPGLRTQLGPDFVLLAGAGEKLIDALDAGADGAIAALANLAQNPVMDENAIAQYAVIPAEITAGRHLGTLITSMFLHANLLHVGGNMLFLWIFGNNVEDRLGEIKFVIIYFAAGIAGSLLQIFIDPTSTVPMLGASGAISGILAAYVLYFPRARVLTFIVPFFFVTLTAYIFIGYWIALNALQAFLNIGVSGGGVAFFAHIGGFVSGLIL